MIDSLKNEIPRFARHPTLQGFARNDIGEGFFSILLEAIAKPRMGPVKRFVFNGRNPVLQLLLEKD